MIIFVYKKEIYWYIIEYVESLYAHIKNMKLVEYQDNIDVSDLNNTYIFIQSAPAIHVNNRNVYLLNIEQLTRNEWLNNISSSRFKLCDYSIGNVQLLENRPVHFLPYQYNHNEVVDNEKIRDIIFIGCLSEYRSQILNKIPNVTTIDSIFGKERDGFLFSHKILVNLHYLPSYNIHEQIRTTRCIFNKMIVVTEKSLDDDNNIMKDFMIITERENIPNVVHDILENYELYYNKLFDKPFDDVIAKLHENIEHFLSIVENGK